jgi:hypothetical protein
MSLNHNNELTADWIINANLRPPELLLFQELAAKFVYKSAYMYLNEQV